jgi:acyltransferase
VKERINWIDIARGIGIILVIYAHGLGATPLRYFIYSFHLPLFFFLSGLVVHSRKNEPYINSLTKDIKKILLPYFFFAFLFFFIWILNLKPESRSPEIIIHQLIGIFYGSGNNRYLIFDIALWFLPCLFLVKQIFWAISKLTDKFIYISLFIFSIAGFLLSNFASNIKLPFGFETAITAIIFFGLGYLWNRKPDIKFKLPSKHLLLLILFSILTIIFAYFNFQIYGLQVDLRLNRLNNYFLFYLAALSGILATIFLSKIINKNKILEYLGKNSLVLFASHLVVFYYISKFLMLFISGETIRELRNIYLAPVYTAISIILILSITEIYKRLKPKL